ncbi:unnamed protein product [Orchesella dallaii]|uniref:C2H2-type domain-containing protein n=1 Tax=Orchesella dallaii TaxID=48710 RepID=A0ABP1QYN1_9HEXA
MTKNHNRQRCETCSKTFASKCGLRRHRMTHNESSTRKQYPCQICKKTFASNRNVRNHVKFVHQKIKKYACDLCKHKFCSAKDLNRHQMTHNKSRTYQYPCKLCKKSFVCSRYLKVHVKYIHESNKKHICIFCKKGFYQVSDLNIHILRHIGERHHWCNICEMECSTPGVLQVHKIKHTKLRPFKCPQCPRTFKMSRYMKYHMKKHKRSSVNCIICSKKLSCKTDLLKHVKCHLNEKPWFCSNCDAEFKRNDELKRHLVKKECQKLKPSTSKTYSRTTTLAAQVEITTELDGEDEIPAPAHIMGNPVDEEESNDVTGTEDPEAGEADQMVDSENSDCEVVAEISTNPEERICRVCRQKFSGDKFDKKFAMHVVAEQHY